MKYLKFLYVYVRKHYHKFRFILTLNIIKTVYFNFKKFPFETAVKFPVYFYGKVKLRDITGTIIIEGNIKSGMIGFGQSYEKSTVHKGTAEILLAGTIVFRGHVQFGKDYFLYVAQNAYADFGHMSSLATGGKVICTNKVTLGNYARLGSESQIMDTNFHQMIDTVTGEKFPMTSPIVLGNYNYIGNRVSVMQGTITGNYCTIASNSLCNKDYTQFGENILIGGIPAKFIRNNISRDWESEKELFEKWLTV